MIAFGPIPSRRLGLSLGINTIAPKHCPYACTYCQVGRTTDNQLDRRTVFEPEEILRATRGKLDQAEAAGVQIDALTIVPDGEPTLDINLGRSIAALRVFGIPVAVISNASLLWQATVRAELALADWVSLKIDSALPRTWWRINRPNKRLRLEAIVKGIEAFAVQFEGKLVTETMLIDGINENNASLESVAALLAEIQPAVAYIAAPTRPPAEPWVRPLPPKPSIAPSICSRTKLSGPNFSSTTKATLRPSPATSLGSSWRSPLCTPCAHQPCADFSPNPAPVSPLSTTW